MPEPPKPLSPKELADLLKELDRVMDEAADLRREVTRQLEEQRHRQLQKLSPVSRRPARKSR
jgi:hypothetical protein